MEIPAKDKSSYLKGLLIIARKDNQLADSEKKIIKDIALSLGFAKDFYEDILKSLLANKYIIEDPIKFSERKIAESFLSDGLKLVYSVDLVTDNKLEWLHQVALINNVDETWFKEKAEKYKSSPNLWMNSEFALYSII